MILFLDFDGVLHPEADRDPLPSEKLFCHRPRFENVMRDFPAVEIVISSMWRYHYPLSELQELFTEDIRNRIIGVTPLTEREAGKYLPTKRESEILQWLSENNRPDEEWFALDDADWQFQQHADRLITCVWQTGFDVAAEARLRQLLMENSRAHSVAPELWHDRKNG